MNKQGLDIELFNYTFPKELIANTPTTPRDSSRLMVVEKNSGTVLSKHTFKDLVSILDENTVLVFNNTKVFPARVIATKKTGGKVELLFLRNTAKNTWEALHKGKVSFGDVLYLKNIKLEVVSQQDKLINVSFSCREKDLFSYMKIYGKTPIPPYITPTDTQKILNKRYQTIYAKYLGSAAAPTAGLHFTKELLQTLKSKGVVMEYLTLHVGLGTFAPVENTDITKHKMHEEYVSINSLTTSKLNRYKLQGKTIIAVGTTTLRALESATDSKGILHPISRDTNIFIYPPYKFKFATGLITNFHLPKSTLLALVSAFASFPNTTSKFVSFKESLLGKAYHKAKSHKYRLFSFGDAMLIK